MNTLGTSKTSQKFIDLFTLTGTNRASQKHTKILLISGSKETLEIEWEKTKR